MAANHLTVRTNQQKPQPQQNSERNKSHENLCDSIPSNETTAKIYKIYFHRTPSNNSKQ